METDLKALFYWGNPELFAHDKCDIQVTTFLSIRTNSTTVCT